MMPGKSPAYQWYPRDILASARVAEMSLAEEGAYRRLLDFCWLNGNVPAECKRIAKVIGKGCTTEVADVVRQMFSPDPNDPECLIHDRLEIEREKQQANSAARKLAAAARWHKPGTPATARGSTGQATNGARNANADAIALHMECSSSSSSSAELPPNPRKRGNGGRRRESPEEIRNRTLAEAIALRLEATHEHA